MDQTYEKYLEMDKCISFEECLALHREMLAEIGSDADALELYKDLIEKATDYIVFRSRWTIRERRWKMDADASRTMKHDAVIIGFNKLARYLQKQGKAASWRDALGYTEEDPSNRRRIGDFSNFLVYVHALNGR